MAERMADRVPHSGHHPHRHHDGDGDDRGGAMVPSKATMDGIASGAISPQVDAQVTTFTGVLAVVARSVTQAPAPLALDTRV